MNTVRTVRIALSTALCFVCLVLSSAACRDDTTGSKKPGDLDRQLAGNTRSTKNQNRFTFNEAGSIADRKPRRHTGIGDRSGLHIINPVR